VYESVNLGLEGLDTMAAGVSEECTPMLGAEEMTLKLDLQDNRSSQSRRLQSIF
jgi:hypothetical protein